MKRKGILIIILVIVIIVAIAFVLFSKTGENEEDNNIDMQNKELTEENNAQNPSEQPIGETEIIEKPDGNIPVPNGGTVLDKDTASKGAIPSIEGTTHPSELN